ncbi:MAG: hypothetical protein LBG42_06550, partial [Treponema sp.]|nr:hypothetical protein [Treponema sp.]
GLVRRWDEIRYGGRDPRRDELLAMVGEAMFFTGALEKAERQRRRNPSGGKADGGEGGSS